MHKTFLSFIMICITSLLYGEIEYGFSALNIGGGFIIFEPFDICGNTPNLIIPSTCSSFGNIMGMTGKFPHVKKLHLKWKYWKSIIHYKNREPGILCEQTISLNPPCTNAEIYDFYICFNKTEVFVVYKIVWKRWKYKECILSNGCPVGYWGDIVGDLSYFKKNPDATSASFFEAMQKKYDYHPARRKNSNYFWLKWSPGKVVHYRKNDGNDVFWGDVEKFDDKNSTLCRLMRCAFEEVMLKIIAKPDITQEEFTAFVKNLGKENECFICNDLATWKRISEIVVKKKMLNPDKMFVEKIIIPELQKQIAIIGETPGKTFTLTFENVLSDEIKVDSKLIDRLKNQGYFSKMFVNKK